MSLDTLINIGHIIRTELNKKESLAYHRYVKKAHLSNSKIQYSYFQFDVTEDYMIDKTSFLTIVLYISTPNVKIFT